MFTPLRVRGGGNRLRRAVRRRRRAMAAGLAMAAAAIAAGSAPPGSAAAQPAASPAERRPAAVERVSAPVRIADAATVRLLRPGDRVDVVAADASPGGDARTRVVATAARVAEVPGPDRAGGAEAEADSGALVVLSVPRPTAAALAGAGMTARLAVILCPTIGQ
ncbi:RcpC/CpaB family pilus assembly protein [Streptomyces sp. SYSU K21746]